MLLSIILALNHQEPDALYFSFFLFSFPIESRYGGRTREEFVRLKTSTRV